MKKKDKKNEICNPQHREAYGSAYVCILTSSVSLNSPSIISFPPIVQRRSKEQRQRPWVKKNSMNVALCDIHSTICCSRVSPSFSPYSLQQPRFAVRNPSQFRANCSLVIQKQDGQVVSNEETPSQPVSVSESFSRRLILLRHAKSSWENRSLRGIFLWESPKLDWEFLFCAYLA